MILSQLFSVLFTNGTVVVTTSNQSPHDLYKDGLNRSYFLPFISLLERHCVVHVMDSDIDFRRVITENMENYYFVCPNDAGSDEKNQMDAIVDALRLGEKAKCIEFAVGGNSGTRYLRIPSADGEGRVARFSFESLCCEQDIGPSD